MNFEFVKTRDNGDATSNYDIKGKFPVRFEEFFKTILNETNSFLVSFHDAENWTTLKVEAVKRNDNWYYKEKKPEDFMEQYKDKLITKVWANGGYGQISYFCTFGKEE